MLKGFDSMAAKTDQAICELARYADELAITEVLLAQESVKVISKLDGIPEAGAWLASLDRFLKVYGNRLSAAHIDITSPTWREDPAPVIETIKSYLPRLQAGWDIEKERSNIIARAGRVVDQFMDSLSGEADKTEFSRLLEIARKVYRFQEDHNFYIDMGSTAALHNTAMACGRRLQSYGLLQTAGDVVFLTFAELTEVLSDLSFNEKIARHHFGRLVPGLVRERKASWEQLRRTREAPLTVGPIPDQMTDPIAVKVLGIVDSDVYPRDEGKATGKLKGFRGAPGVVEGRARVVTSFEDFPRLQVGEILVCPATTTSWTSLFLKISGVVTDTGGMLSHTAIAAGEYGVPAVVGTWNATSSIQDGDLIQVNGDEGVVEVKQRARPA